MGYGLAQRLYSNHYLLPHFLILDISLLFDWILIPKNLWRCPDTFSTTSEIFIKIWGGQFLRSIFTNVTTTLAILFNKPRRGVSKATLLKLPQHYKIEKLWSNNSKVTTTSYPTFFFLIYLSYFTEFWSQKICGDAQTPFLPLLKFSSRSEVANF